MGIADAWMQACAAGCASLSSAILEKEALTIPVFFCNPEYPTATLPGCSERRVNMVADAAQLERHRLLSWITAWAGLSVAWHLEDGGNADTALAVAGLALCVLRR